MRVYEFSDLKTIPTDLVREQDFILRLRRWQRQNQAMTVAQVQLSSMPQLASDSAEFGALEKKLREALTLLKGELYYLSNHDALICLPAQGKTTTQQEQALLQLLLGLELLAEKEFSRLVKIYHLPTDYVPLREQLNRAIDAIRAIATLEAVQPTAQQLLQSEQVRGPLSAWSLSQIELLLEDLDVQRYIRAQPIYVRKGDRWQAVATEYYISIEELKQERFPKLNLRAPERLFMELCCTLDKRLLTEIARQPKIWENQKIHMNLAIETALAANFAQFCRLVPLPLRGNIVFELNRADLLFDFITTLNVLEVLRQEGFGIALDGLHPELLPYLNCALLPVDWYKIKVSKDHFSPLSTAPVINALQHLPKDKVIFYRCEQEAALAIGQHLGIRTYQGWLIDDLALGV